MSASTVSEHEDDGPDSRLRPALRDHKTEQDPMLGQIIDSRYRIEDILGVGGVGVVYEARHLKLQHSVALKLLREGFEDSPIVRRRFEREAKLLSELSHPHIVALTDYGIHEGAPYLVMERLEGRSLDAKLAAETLEPSEAIDIVKAIARALAFAHDKGVLHRDLKPGNVFLQRVEGGGEHPKLLDFGLAKLFDVDADSEEFEPTLTRAGTILGTPAYMAPEQASGSTVGPRADVYSFGIVLFELLAGRPPFLADRRTELLRQHMLEAVPDPSFFRAGLTLSDPLRQLLLKCLSKEPSGRHADGAALCEALDALPFPVAAFEADDRSDVTRPIVRRTLASQRPTVKRRRTQPLMWVVGILMAMVAVAFFVFADTTETPVAPPDPPASPATAAARPAAELEDPTEAPPGLQPEAASEGPPAGAESDLDVQDFFAQPLPPELDAIAQELSAEEELNRTAHRSMRVYQRMHPEDPRPTLLLAHDLADRASWGPALERYELAYRRWPESMGDPRMLSDLVELSSRENERAVNLLAEIYGESAAPVVEQRLAESEHRPTRLVLTRVLERLRPD